MRRCLLSLRLVPRSLNLDASKLETGPDFPEDIEPELLGAWSPDPNPRSFVDSPLSHSIKPFKP